MDTATPPSEVIETEGRQKDLKKQEAGRKGAEARKKKMEILMAELAATKEKVHASYENEHTSSAPAASEPQRTLALGYRCPPSRYVLILFARRGTAPPGA